LEGPGEEKDGKKKAPKKRPKGGWGDRSEKGTRPRGKRDKRREVVPTPLLMKKGP